MVSMDTMGEGIPTTPEAYEQRVNEMKVSEARSFFDKYDMMECNIAENIMTVKKTGAGHDLKFELHKFGLTNEIMKEAATELFLYRSGQPLVLPQFAQKHRRKIIRTIRL